jgi:hypothetical protein
MTEASKGGRLTVVMRRTRQRRERRGREPTPEGWSRVIVTVAALLEIGGNSIPALEYRPFVSTDAAVVDPREIEVELSYFSLEWADEENTFIFFGPFLLISL